MSDYTETEVKVYCPDLQSIQAKLEALGGKLVKPRVFERNARYENADSSLTPQGIVVRLRKDDRVRLTYKGPGAVINGMLTRYEAEVEVSDFDTMSEILGRLGHFPYMVYEKYRATYEYLGTEIVLDELPYGNFIEIEGSVKTIEAALQKLELADARRYPTSYIHLFERIRDHLNLRFRDLTFANFQGIHVSEDAFRPPNTTRIEE